MNIFAIRRCTLFITALTGLTAFAVGCGQPALAPDNRAADEAALMQADAAWSDAASKKDLNAVMAAVADGALDLPPNKPIIEGKDGFQKDWEEIVALPDVSLSWKATKAVAARSGELGYTYGTYQFSFTGPDGNPVNDNGKYVTIWSKQDDGSWKVTADIYNTSLPLPAPPAAPGQ